MSEKRRLMRMLKDNETTTKSDYLPVKLRPIVKTEWKPRPTCAMVRGPPLKDTHSMTDWRIPKVPYNLYWKEEADVDHANPNVPQKPYQTPVDNEREFVQKIRPRLFMTPAVPLDAMAEPKRKMLIDAIYLSATERLLRQPYEITEAEHPTLRIKAPLPAMYTPPKPITIRKLNAAYVSPEWRMESISWDGRMDRTFTEPTKEFWLRRGRDTKI